MQLCVGFRKEVIVVNKFGVLVLMPFASKFNGRYSAIERSANSAGFLVERVDRQAFYRKGITTKLLENIESADILVADVSTSNPNVFYEVGYAYAKRKLCVLLTKKAKDIPFDLKDQRHVIFSGIQDLESKLLEEFTVLKREAELSFNASDPECFAQVNTVIVEQKSVRVSPAISIRVKVRNGSEVDRKNVSGRIVKLERRRANKWKQFRSDQPIPLIWTDTNSMFTDFLGDSSKYLNVLHIDSADNQMKIWNVPMSAALSEFLREEAKYRITVAAMDRQIRIDIVWRGCWNNTPVVVPTRKARKAG